MQANISNDGKSAFEKFSSVETQSYSCDRNENLDFSKVFLPLDGTTIFQDEFGQKRVSLFEIIGAIKNSLSENFSNTQHLDEEITFVAENGVVEAVLENRTRLIVSDEKIVFDLIKAINMIQSKDA